MLNQNAGFTLTVLVPGEAPDITAGSWTLQGTTLTVSAGGEELVFTVALSGNNLSLTGATVPFDFNGDDIDEPATADLALVRQ